MPVNSKDFSQIKDQLTDRRVSLVAVSKTKPVEDILELYHLGQRDFGENYVQEMIDKAVQLPQDIHWHFIGHLQSNKVKYIAPFVQLIHGVDSLKLLKEINKQAGKNNRVINCLLQVHLAVEETKFGLDENELRVLMLEYHENPMSHVAIKGLMGMASFTSDMEQVRSEFRMLKSIFDKIHSLAANPSGFNTISMGMSSDYKIAIEEGSNMVRIGSLLFGERIVK